MSTAAAIRRSHPRRSLLVVAARLVNPLVVRLAGTRWLPLYGVLEHRGRRTGKRFRTPVVARPTAGGFVIPMPWGETTDWFLNLRAANSCVLRWKDRDYPLTDPEPVDTAAVASAFTPLQRLFLPRLGIRRCLRLRHAT